jgi:RNA polymerase sigma-70 factor, ECF subfamily
MDADDELIIRVAAKDDMALRELFARHAPWLAARLRAALPASDVEDVLQETFLAVWTSAPRYQPQGSAGGWLWQIARRQAALFLRRRGPATLPLPPSLDSGVAATDDPTDIALTRAQIADALTSLGPAHSPAREIWQLAYVEDRPLAEVAALTNLPVGTVKSRAHRVRQLLRAALRNGQATETSEFAEGGTQ